MIAFSPTLLIVRIIKIRQTEHMAELVTHGAYTVEEVEAGLALNAIHLSGAGIATQAHTVFIEIVPCVRIVELAGVGPDVLHPFTVVGTIAGKDDIHHVDNTILIKVVLAEVHLCVGRVGHLLHQLRSLRRLVRIFFADIHSKRSGNIKLRRKNTIGIIMEIVAHTACKDACAYVAIALIAILIDHIIHHLRIVFTRELAILVLHKDDESAKVAVVELWLIGLNASTGTGLPGPVSLLTGSSIGTHSRHQILADTLQPLALIVRALGFVTGHTVGRFQLSVGIQTGIAIKAVATPRDGIAVLGSGKVEILVAMQAHRKSSAVRLLTTDHSRIRWNSLCHAA